MAALKFALRPRAMVRAAPIALGVSCTALALLLSLRGEEPVPPRIVRERHQYHQPVPPAFHAAIRKNSSQRLNLASRFQFIIGGRATDPKLGQDVRLSSFRYGG